MMNLIERLGGYDNAKKLRGTTSNALLDMKTWQVHVDDIDSALLKYRRANNIFEVGDKVFHIDEDGPILTVDRILACEDDYRRTIIDIDWKGGFGWVRAFKLKHATDLEIQVGHRL